MRTMHISLFAAGLLLAGCQGQTSGDSSAASQASAAAVAKPLTISEITVGKVKGDTQTATPLTTADPIAVTLKTTGTTKGADLDAKLFNLGNGQVAATQTKRIVADAPATTELVFQSDNGWAAGRHLLEIKLDGKLAEQRDIDIVAAPPANQK